MTKKQLRLFTIMLPFLGIVAFLVNQDAILGNNTKKPNAAPPPAAEGSNGARPPANPAPDSGPKPIYIYSDPPAPEATEHTISASTLKSLLQGVTDTMRDPFQTLSEQEPEVADDKWPPPEKYAEIIMIRPKTKYATIEGQRVREGDTFHGGKVSSITADKVVVDMSKGRQWTITLKIPSVGGIKNDAPQQSQPK